MIALYVSPCFALDMNEDVKDVTYDTLRSNVR